jgi:hypothetical protein
MCHSKIDAAGRGRVPEGKYGNSKFEQWVKQFEAMALGFVGGKKWGMSPLFLLRSWEEILSE